MPQSPVFATVVVVAVTAGTLVTVNEETGEKLPAYAFVPRNTALRL